MLDLKARGGRIGCSQIAGCFGIGFATPLQTYNVIKGIEEVEETEAMITGREIQPVLEMKYHRLKMPESFIAPKEDNRLSPKYEWLVGSPDLMLLGDGELRGVELKNSSWFAGWGKESEPWRDAVPQHYQLQCMGYMMLYNMQKWDIAVYLGGADFRVWTIERDDKMVRSIEIVCGSFWDNNLVPNIAPPPSKVEEYIAHAKAVKGKELEATKTLIDEIYQYRAAREVVALKQTEMELCKRTVLELMSDAESLWCSDDKLAEFRTNKNGRKSFIIL